MAKLHPINRLHTIQRKVAENPPSMYNEVSEHLKEMLKIRRIQPSHSPWASPVVLVGLEKG